MDTKAQSELGELRKLMADLAHLLTAVMAATLPKPKPKPKPRPAAELYYAESDSERMERDFAFQREHGHVIEGRVDRATGYIDWHRSWRR